MPISALMIDGHPRHVVVAGASARRKARRLQEDRKRLTAGRSAARRLIAAVFASQEEQRLQREERNWTVGAEGEEMLARSLAKRCPRVPMLLDRRAPMMRGNIDMIALAPSGVYVIDCKRHKGKVQVSEPLFAKVTLRVNGRARTRLVTGLERQVSEVRAALEGLGDGVPVHGCLCFVAPQGFLADSGLPLLRTLTVRGYPVYYPKRLARRLRQPGPLTPEQVEAIGGQLERRLPSALPGDPY